MTERVRFRVQAVEIGFLQKVRSLSLLDKIKSTDICESLNIEPLLLIDIFLSVKTPRGRLRTRWWNYAKDLAWSRLGISPAELPLVAKGRDAWRSQLELLPLQPQKNKRVKRNALN